MTDNIDKKLTHIFDKSGFYKFDAAMQKTLESIPLLGIGFKAMSDALDKTGVTNRALLEKHNKENPDDQVHNPYSDVSPAATSTNGRDLPQTKKDSSNRLETGAEKLALELAA